MEFSTLTNYKELEEVEIEDPTDSSKNKKVKIERVLAVGFFIMLRMPGRSKHYSHIYKNALFPVWYYPLIDRHKIEYDIKEKLNKEQMEEVLRVSELVKVSLEKSKRIVASMEVIKESIIKGSE